MTILENDKEHQLKETVQNSTVLSLLLLQDEDQDNHDNWQIAIFSASNKLKVQEDW